MSINPYVSFGSFNTQLYGVELDSGTIESTGGTRILADGEGLTSDGYLTNMGQQRENGFIKIVQPIGADTELTLVGMYNTLHQNISLGATAAEIAKFGPNFALSTNPNSQNFAGYNNDQIHTDFEYADINSNFGDGWNLNAKIYTYGYFHVAGMVRIRTARRRTGRASGRTTCRASCCRTTTARSARSRASRRICPSATSRSASGMITSPIRARCSRLTRRSAAT